MGKKAIKRNTQFVFQFGIFWFRNTIVLQSKWFSHTLTLYNQGRIRLLSLKASSCGKLQVLYLGSGLCPLMVLAFPDHYCGCQTDFLFYRFLPRLDISNIFQLLHSQLFQELIGSRQSQQSSSQSSVDRSGVLSTFTIFTLRTGAFFSLSPFHKF